MVLVTSFQYYYCQLLVTLNRSSATSCRPTVCLNTCLADRYILFLRNSSFCVSGDSPGVDIDGSETTQQLRNATMGWWGLMFCCEALQRNKVGWGFILCKIYTTLVFCMLITFRQKVIRILCIFPMTLFT